MVKTPVVRIEIAGGIASGKTTLAQLLAKVDSSLALVEEDFAKNPLWVRFSGDPERFAREKNASFLAQHVGEIKAVPYGNMVCDFAVFQDLGYASLAEDAEHLAAMRGMYNDLYRRLTPPAAVVHLRCSPRAEMERLRLRGRAPEQALTLDYLERVNAAIEKFLGVLPSGTPTLSIDSESVDFRNPDAKALEWVNLILTKAYGDLQKSARPV